MHDALLHNLVLDNMINFSLRGSIGCEHGWLETKPGKERTVVGHDAKASVVHYYILQVVSEGEK